MVGDTKYGVAKLTHSGADMTNSFGQSDFSVSSLTEKESRESLLA